MPGPPSPDPHLPIVQGTVKFWKPNGVGGIESTETPGDVHVLWSVIDMPGYHELRAGQLVEFQFVAQSFDSWHYRATWVRPIADGS